MLSLCVHPCGARVAIYLVTMPYTYTPIITYKLSTWGCTFCGWENGRHYNVAQSSHRLAQWRASLSHLHNNRWPGPTFRSRLSPILQYHITIHLNILSLLVICLPGHFFIPSISMICSKALARKGSFFHILHICAETTEENVSDKKWLINNTLTESWENKGWLEFPSCYKDAPLKGNMYMATYETLKFAINRKRHKSDIIFPVPASGSHLAF